MTSPAPGRAEAIIDRLHARYPRLIDLSLDRLRNVLDRLGNPQDRLPPVIHVAGTNGKGSTCAFLRAMGEAQGWRVHVTTSPHLVRFNERIRIAGDLVTDAALSAAVDRIEAANGLAPLSVFELLVAATFVLFADAPAELCILETGLGGRFDATNVIARPAACAITSISLDHREMLGDTLEKIAFEKAGIFKPGVPAVTGAQPANVLAVLQARADALGSRLAARDRDWTATQSATGFRFADAADTLNLPPPALLGAHQIDNAAIAIAAFRAAGLPVMPSAIAQAIWPARMQRLLGAVLQSMPPGWEVWLDGGHNPGGGEAVAAQLRSWNDRPTHVVVGMKQAKDTAEFLAPIMPLAASLWAVSEPGQHLALPVERIIAASGGVAKPGPTVAAALAQIASIFPPGRVLICGSLYLAGEVLKQDGYTPT